MKLVKSSSILITVFVVTSLLLLVPVLVRGECTCDLEESDGEGNNNKNKALKFKLGAIDSILVFGAIGVCLPLVSKIFPSCKPGSDIFFMIKAFAAGVILATGFIHVLPDAFEHLTSPCLKDNPWGVFPFTGFISMMGTIGTLMVDTFATSYYKRRQSNNKPPPVGVDEENDGHIHIHTHATHGHAHGADVYNDDDDDSTDLIRHRIISQVLELGIVVHSVIIGISLGASESPSTVKTLLIALSFHQFFEGMGLGGCISQAKFKSRAVICMGFFFAITTPFGIALGIGISNIYKENSPTALIVEGCFNSASAGILIYMALVDLLAADFMSSNVQSSGKLQLQVYIFLLAGAGSMSLLAKWA